MMDHPTFGPWYAKYGRESGWPWAAAGIAVLLVIIVPLVLLTLAAIAVGVVVLVLGLAIARVVAIVRNMWSPLTGKAPFDDGRRNVRVIR